MALLTESGKREESAVDSRKQQRRWGSSLTGSLLVHLALVAVWCWPVAPRVLAPRLVARGDGGNAMGATGTVLYLPSAVRVAQPASAREHALLAPPPREEKLPTSGVKERSNALEVEHPSGTRQAGSTIGTSYAGLWGGDEIKPALPSVFPDLTIHRNELPAGIEGDVIVEVTIDAQGVVIEQRLLQRLGHGIDERVIAVLQEWRFRPATRNGIPIPSKHDVHFHFPS